MKSKKDTLKKSKKRYLEIDELPLYNFNKMMSDPRFVNRDEVYRKGDELHAIKLYNDYLDRYGLGDDYEKYMSYQEKYIKISGIFVINEDEAVLNDLHFIEAELKRLNPNNFEGMSVESCLTHLSKWIGYNLNSRDITIVRFREMLKEYGRTNKKE